MTAPPPISACSSARAESSSGRSLAARPRVRGFSLVELMIGLAVVGVIAGIAYPSFTENIRKGRRADAQAVLAEAAQFMERFYTENNRYDQDLGGTAVALPPILRQAPKEGATKYYDISLLASGLNATGYTLLARPKNAQASDTCLTLRLTSTGIKDVGSVSGTTFVASTAASTAACWRR